MIQLHNLEQEYLQLLSKVEEAEGELTPERLKVLNFAMRQLGNAIRRSLEQGESRKDSVEAALGHLNRVFDEYLQGGKTSRDTNED